MKIKNLDEELKKVHADDYLHFEVVFYSPTHYYTIAMWKIGGLKKEIHFLEGSETDEKRGITPDFKRFAQSCEDVKIRYANAAVAFDAICHALNAF